jgi:hypothetical protein
MMPMGFDQTNGTVSGLRGDDDGSLAAPVPDSSVEGFVQRALGAGRVPPGTAPADQDPSVTPYSEEGAV